MISRARRIASSHHLRTLVLAASATAIAGTGCLQILGLDSYKEGGGGAGTSGTQSTGTMSSGSMSSGTMSSGTMSSSSGSTSTGTGGGSPATCSTQGSLVDVMSGADLSHDVAMAFDATSHNSFVATSFGGMNGSGVRINIVRDNGNIDTPQTWMAQGGGVTVGTMRLVPGLAVVYVRAGNQVGEVQFPLSMNGFSGGAPTFVAYNDIPDVACSNGGSINTFAMREPLDPAQPHYVAVCHHTAPDYEKVYIADRTTAQQVSQEVVNEPADKLRDYFLLPNGQQIMVAGGDPTSGTWYRTGTSAAELATKRVLNVESDPMRASVAIAETIDPMGGIQMFVATLDKTSITPARMYVTGAPANNLGVLAMVPPPNTNKILDISMLSQIAGFAPLAVTPGRLAGAGSTVDKKTVLFTLLKPDGTILTRDLVRTADPGLSIDQATTISTSSPNYLVTWGEGNQTNTTIHAQFMLCIGG